MIRALALTLVAVVGLTIVVGCGNKASSTPPVNAGVTDVTPAPAATYTPPPVAAQPVVFDTPQPAISSSSTGGSTIGSGGSYTIKKGDTLYSIARSRYGDGKQWQKIAAANPGVRPETLKVGQTITIP